MRQANASDAQPIVVEAAADASPRPAHTDHDHSAWIERILSQRQPRVESLDRVSRNLDTLERCLTTLSDGFSTHPADTKIDVDSYSPLWNSVDLKDLQDKITAQVAALKRLHHRFSRKTLDWAVVGDSGAGKSTLLQAITGLGNREIPVARGAALTAVRSMIVHDPDRKIFAHVFFHSAASLFSEVIKPYIRELESDTQPEDIQQFVQNPLPPLSDALKHDPSKVMLHGLLGGYHQQYNNYKHLLIGKRNTVHKNDENWMVRYVALRDPDTGEEVFDHFAVRQVEIHCPFQHAGVRSIRLIDLPGRGEIRLGIDDNIKDTIGKDVDLVIFVNKPDADRYQWNKPEADTYQLVGQALTPLPLPRCSFRVLNQHRTGANEEACRKLAGTAASHGMLSAGYIVCDCSSNGAAASLVETILRYLENNLKSIDDDYLATTRQSLRDLHDFVQKRLATIQEALSTAYDGLQSDSQLRPLQDDLFENLCVKLRSVMDELSKKRDDANEDMLKAAKAMCQLCEEQSGLPSVEEIERKIARYVAPQGAFEFGLNLLRTTFRSHFSGLEEAGNRTIAQAKIKVANALAVEFMTGNLARLTTSRELELLEFLARDMPHPLGSKFQMLHDFQLSNYGWQRYLGNYLEQFYLRSESYNAETEIEYPSRQHEYSQNEHSEAKRILAQLSKIHTDLLKDIRRQLESVPTENSRNSYGPSQGYNYASQTDSGIYQLLREPNQVALAIIQEFMDLSIYDRGRDQDWFKYFEGHRVDIWGDIYGRIEKTKDYLNGLSKIVQETEVNQDMDHLTL